MESHILERLLESARQADDPARRVARALADDPLFAVWAADEAARELDTPTTARPGAGRLVVHASGTAAGRMRTGVADVLGTRPVHGGVPEPRDRLLLLLSPGGAVSGTTAAGPPAATLALVLGTPTPEVAARLDALGAVCRRLGEDRSVVARVQRAARDAGYRPVVLHRTLRGRARDAGRGLARAAGAVAAGVGGVARPACLLVVGELAGEPGEPGEPEGAPDRVLAAAARAVLATGGRGIRVGATAVGAGERTRVLGVALVP
jgi:hypothetical protein